MIGVRLGYDLGYALNLLYNCLVFHFFFLTMLKIKEYSRHIENLHLTHPRNDRSCNSNFLLRFGLKIGWKN